MQPAGGDAAVPERRSGRLPLLLACLLAAAGLLWQTAAATSWTSALLDVLLLTLSLLLGVLLQALWALAAELPRLADRHGGSLSAAWRDCLPGAFDTGHTFVSLLSVAAIFAVLLACLQDLTPAALWHRYGYLLAVSLVYPFVAEGLDLSESELSSIQEEHPVNIGNALAVNFFRYLEKRVVNTLDQRLVEFEQVNDVRLHSRRLYILCPDSCDLPASLTSLDPEGISLLGEVRGMQAPAAGNRHREYGKHPVYRLSHQGRTASLALEGSTIHANLAEVRGISERDRQEQARLMTRRLQRLLQDKVYHTRIVLVPYKSLTAAAPMAKFLLDFLEKKCDGRLWRSTD